MNSLVLRQLKRYFKGEVPTDARFDSFLQAVSDAYDAEGEDRALLERTMELLSKETQERYESLQLDIQQREKAENERDAFFRASSDMLTIVSDALEIVQASPSWERTLGYPPAELKGKALLELVHTEDRPRIVDGSKENASTPGLGHFEVRVKSKSGDWRWISAAVTVGNGLFFVVSRDVTAEREQSREQAQAQKLEAVGQLASGVAHEINTPVQFVGDNVQFLSDSFSDLLGYLEAVQAVLTPEQLKSLEEATRKADLEYLQEEVPRSLSEAKEGVRRVAELVRALKEFAHPDQPEKTVADLNKALERAAVLARGELKHLAAVELKLGAIPPIACHVGSLSQVFVNLLVNAAHAVEERTRKFNVPAQQQRVTVRTWVDGDEVAIAISDTGCGIPESIRERVFEPFFTTKPMGKGTGQGLPLVRNVVVRKHGGRIELESVVNEGTTFTLRLPIDAARAKKAA